MQVEYVLHLALALCLGAAHHCGCQLAKHRSVLRLVRHVVITRRGAPALHGEILGRGGGGVGGLVQACRVPEVKVEPTAPAAASTVRVEAVTQRAGPPARERRVDHLRGEGAKLIGERPLERHRVRLHDVVQLCTDEGAHVQGSKHASRRRGIPLGPLPFAPIVVSGRGAGGSASVRSRSMHAAEGAGGSRRRRRARREPPGGAVELLRGTASGPGARQGCPCDARYVAGGHVVPLRGHPSFRFAAFFYRNRKPVKRVSTGLRLVRWRRR
mmetsp:Transcript_3983/g.6219  ORF Transcript_3983/g.6219 Transcript_3983/m.6219 type:complete len:270 (-) Transcript_3983:93-902(-)